MSLDATKFDPSLALLKQFFTTATQHASAAMCQWTHGQVMLTLDELHVAPLEEAMKQFEEESDLVTMVVLGVEGSSGAQLILAFDDENGRKLAATLLQREPNDQPEWSDLEKSAVMETGNILASAYLNELTRLADRKLVPSAPYFVQDFGASVLQQALMIQAMTSDHVMVSRTRFEFNSQAVNWKLLFFPDEELRQALYGTVEAAL